MLDNIKQKLKDAPNWARDALKRAVIRTEKSRCPPRGRHAQGYGQPD